MNKFTLIQLLDRANISSLVYSNKVVFILDEVMHECFFDEDNRVAAEELWDDGMTLDEYAAGRF